MKTILRKIISGIFLFLIGLKAFAPSMDSLVIIDKKPINPFKQLIYAIGKVETDLDTLSYNPFEEAIGFFQIRPIRVEDYNYRTGSNLKHNDMFNYETSEKVFLYYASQIGPYDFEKIAVNWNGSGSQTVYYWKRVKEYL
jgi:hypothetical protein